MATIDPALSTTLGLRVRPRSIQLPNIRAAVGASLIVFALLLTLIAYQRANRTPSTLFLVARESIGAGKTISASDLALAPMRLPNVLAHNSFQHSSSLIGKTLNVSLNRGDLVQGSFVSNVTGSSSRQVVLALDDAHSFGGAAKANDSVDVIATTGTGSNTQTKVLLANTKIISVSVKKGAISGSTSQLVTIAVPGQAEEVAIVQAQDSGKVTLVRTTGL